MNRKSFLKKLGAGALLAAVAPKVIANAIDQESSVAKGPFPGWNQEMFANDNEWEARIRDNMEGRFLQGLDGGKTLFAIDASLIPNNMTPEEFIAEWRRDNGTIIYNAHHGIKRIEPADMSNVRILRGKEAEENYATAAD